MSTERRPPRQRARFGELQDHAVLPARESAHRETRDIALLLEENARLRRRAVELSNLLGDFPERGALRGPAHRAD